MGLIKGTKLTDRWDALTAEEIANKMLSEPASAKLHRANQKQEPCLICIKLGLSSKAPAAQIPAKQWYYKHSGRKDKVTHKKCVIENATVNAKTVKAGNVIDMSLTKEARIVGGSESPRQTGAPAIDKRSFDAGYLACIQKLVGATADEPALQKAVLAKLIGDTAFDVAKNEPSYR